MSNLSELLPAGAGAKSADFVASGTLGSGVTVALKADGTVEAVTASVTEKGIGARTTTNTGSTLNNSAVYDPVNNKVIIAFEDQPSGSAGKAIVGTVSGSTISFGAEVQFASFVRYVSASFSVNSGKVIIGYQDRANTEKGTAIVGTVSGTSISFGTPIVFNNGATQWINVSYDAAGVKTVFHFMAEQVSSYGLGRVANISGTSMSFGTAVTFNSATTSEIYAAFSETEEKCVVAYKDPTGVAHGEVIVGTVSGTSISYGSSIDFTSTSVDNIYTAYDPDAQKWVVAFRDENNSDYGTSFVASVSGTAVSKGTSVVFASSTTQDPVLVYDTNVNKMTIFFRNVSNSSYVWSTIGAVSGTSITWDTASLLLSRGYTNTSGAYDPDTNQIVFCGQDTTVGQGQAFMYTNAYTVTNSADFIGITDQAIADTATGAVIVQGGVITNSTLGPVSISAGTPVVFEAANTIYTTTAYDSTNNRIVVAYRDNGNSGYGTAVVGTVSGSTISFGTPVVFRSETCNRNSIVFDSNSNKVVISFQRALTNFYYGFSIVGTVSGTSISFGTAATFTSSNPDFISSTFDSSNNKVVISYHDASNSGYGTAIVGTVSGTSISFGSSVIFESSNTQLIASTFDSGNNKVVIAYSDIGNSNYGTAVVGTVSGTSISFGSPVIFLAYSAQGAVAITYDSNAQKTVVIYQDSNNGYYGTAKVGTVSGTSISFGTGAVFGQINTEYSAVFEANNNKVVVAYQDASNSSYGTVVLGSVSGTGITFGTPIVFEAAQSTSISTAFDSTENKVVISYEDVGNSNNGTAVVTNSAASLTTGSDYYVQADGSLSTTVSSVPAGRALSSTSILLEG